MKRESVGSVIQGVDRLFETENNLPETVTSPKADTAEETGTGTVEVTATNTETVEDTDTLTDTVTSPLIKPTEILFRMIGYYPGEQRKFIKSKAKKYKVTEAEIMRIAMDELIKSGKI